MENERKLTQLVDADKIVFDYVTVEWFVTCKSNKIAAFNGIRTLDIFREKYDCNVRRL